MTTKKRPILALIPARSGSKGLLGKNMRKVQGVPLVGYTLRAALNSKLVNEVYLSSDDESILDYGKEVGAITLYRPAEFSTDIAPASEVVKHFFDNLPKHLLKKNPIIVYLQPTSPLRTAEHVDEALEKMMQKGFNALVSVTLLVKSPFKSFLVDQDGSLKALFSQEMTNQRRQDLPPVYGANGAIYVFLYSDFKENNTFPSNGSLPYFMNEKDSIDIDTKEDLINLERIMNKEY